MALVVVAVSYLLYAAVIPRSELTVNTVVHESFSGISVGIKVKNSGTLDVHDLKLNITVTNQDGEVEYEKTVDAEYLGKYEEIEHSFTYHAPQIDSYDLRIIFTYTSDGLEYNETVKHRIQDYLNMNWEDKLTDWKF